MKTVLTRKEEEFYDKYLDYLRAHLKEPSREELAFWFKSSPQLVQHYLKQLKEKGWLPDTKYRPRADSNPEALPEK
jgi:dsDNA-binding SOS-regulon protein